MNGGRVAVTGGSGFIGANLCLEIAGRGHDVACLDVLPPPTALRSGTRPSGSVGFVPCDVSELHGLRDAFAQVRPVAVVHAAAITVLDLEEERRRYQDVVRVNVLGTANVLSALPSSVERVVFVSSASVHGPTGRDEIIPETRTPAPSNLYGVTKLTGELLCREWAETRDADVRIVRLSNTYGQYERETPSSRGQSLPFLVATDLLRGRTSAVGQASHDWTYITDVARGVVDVLESDVVRERIYNVSAGVPVPDALLADLLTAALRSRGLVSETLRSAVDRSRCAPPRGVLDARRIQAEFGYQPQMTPETGVRAYVDWIIERGLPSGFMRRGGPTSKRRRATGERKITD